MASSSVGHLSGVALTHDDLDCIRLGELLPLLGDPALLRELRSAVLTLLLELRSAVPALTCHPLIRPPLSEQRHAHSHRGDSHRADRGHDAGPVRARGNDDDPSHRRSLEDTVPGVLGGHPPSRGLTASVAGPPGYVEHL